MAQDQFGNYVCDIEPAPAPYPTSSRCCHSGVGPPNDADGENGQTYVNLTNGDIYTKAGDVWILVSGGGGGGGSSTGGTVDPEGVVTAAQWTLYTNTANATHWVKQSAGTGNTGWQQYV